MYETVIKKLLSANTVAIFMHINPDGDCVSSSLALYAYLTKAGKTCHCFLEPGNKPRDNLLFLPYIEAINRDSLKKYDLAIAVDCATSGRLGIHSYKKFQKCADHICIDHHIGNTPFVETMVLEPTAASTTQIIYKILKEADETLLDKVIATLLYAGIITDSGGLSFSSTSPETLHIAAELSDYGVDIYMLNRKLSKDIKQNVFQLKINVLSKAQFYYDNRVGIISFCDQDFAETGTSVEDTEGIINEIVDIIGIKIAIAISAIGKDGFKVGIRTKDGVDASACAGYFGGGGHYNAAGCRIYAPYNIAIERLLEMSGQMLDV